jgi:hypothetical protein
MLDIAKILKTSWNTLWNYRTLWLVGFLLALTVGGGAGSGSNYSFNDNDFNPGRDRENGSGEGWDVIPRGADSPEEMMREVQSAWQTLQSQYPQELRLGISALVLLVVIGLVLGLLGAVARYVAETAAIRMVDEYQQAGFRVGWREVWAQGWNVSAWRLLLVNFLLNLPVFFFLLSLLLVGWWFFASVLGGEQSAILTSLVAGGGVVLLIGLFTWFVMLFLNLLREFAWRFITLQNAGVWQSIRLAGGLFKRQWKNIGLMWLVMIAVNLGWGIGFLLLLLPLLLISVFTSIGAAAISAIPVLLAAGAASLLSAPGYWPWVFGAIFALPLFSALALSPILVARGWGLVYQSGVWTTTYRELLTLESPSAPQEEPAIAAE